MNKNEIKQLIKEEIQKVLSEGIFNRQKSFTLSNLKDRSSTGLTWDMGDQSHPLYKLAEDFMDAKYGEKDENGEKYHISNVTTNPTNSQGKIEVISTRGVDTFQIPPGHIKYTHKKYEPK